MPLAVECGYRPADSGSSRGAHRSGCEPSGSVRQGLPGPPTPAARKREVYIIASSRVGSAITAAAARHFCVRFRGVAEEQFEARGEGHFHPVLAVIGCRRRSGGAPPARRRGHVHLFEHVARHSRLALRDRSFETRQDVGAVAFFGRLGAVADSIVAERTLNRASLPSSATRCRSSPSPISGDRRDSASASAVVVAERQGEPVERRTTRARTSDAPIDGDRLRRPPHSSQPRATRPRRGPGPRARARCRMLLHPAAARGHHRQHVGGGRLPHVLDEVRVLLGEAGPAHGAGRGTRPPRAAGRRCGPRRAGRRGS